MKKFLALLLSVMLLVCLTGCSASDYKAAVAAKDAGDYDAAAEAFKALGDYKDSADLEKAYRYESAKVLLDGGEFDAAAEAFEALGDYEDSTDLLAQAKTALLEKLVTGDWSCFLLLEDQVAEEIAAQVGMTVEEAAEYFSFPGYGTQYLLTVGEDKSFSISMDMDAFRQTCDTLSEQLAPCFNKYFEKAFSEEAEANGMTLEDLYGFLGVEDLEGLLSAALGISPTDFYGQIADLIYEETESLMTGLDNFSGTWEAVAGSVTLTIGDDEFVCPYDEAADTLTLSDPALKYYFSSEELVFTR